MALAAISSVGGAFAVNAKPHKLATTYYAVRLPGETSGFHWQTNKPDASDFACKTVTSGICSITTNTAPMDGQVPAGHAQTDKVYLPQ